MLPHVAIEDVGRSPHRAEMVTWRWKAAGEDVIVSGGNTDVSWLKR